MHYINSCFSLQKLSFPQVTICNINMIRKSKFPNEILQEYPELLDECKLSRYIIEN